MDRGRVNKRQCGIASAARSREERAYVNAARAIKPCLASLNAARARNSRQRGSSTLFLFIVARARGTPLCFRKKRRADLYTLFLFRSACTHTVIILGCAETFFFITIKYRAFARLLFFFLSFVWVSRSSRLGLRTIAISSTWTKKQKKILRSVRGCFSNGSIGRFSTLPQGLDCSTWEIHLSSLWDD